MQPCRMSKASSSTSFDLLVKYVFDKFQYLSQIIFFVLLSIFNHLSKKKKSIFNQANKMSNYTQNLYDIQFLFA